MRNEQNILLGVNIDHIATLRQARGVNYPEPVAAAEIAMQAGADSITVHLREDRRHIQEKDVLAIRQLANTPLNLEMAATDEMCNFAIELKPDYCCIVPENRQELTTEGGLDVISSGNCIAEVCKKLKDAGIRVSLFIDANHDQITASKDAGADMIEIHTGHYANAHREQQMFAELEKIRQGVNAGIKLELQVNAGHGLHYDNVSAVSSIYEISELNIGHSIISRAVFTGIGNAVKEMKSIMLESRQ